MGKRLSSESSLADLLEKERRRLETHPPYGAFGEPEVTKVAFGLIDSMDERPREQLGPNQPSRDELLTQVGRVLGVFGNFSVDERMNELQRLRELVEKAKDGGGMPDIHEEGLFGGQHTDGQNANTSDGVYRWEEGR